MPADAVEIVRLAGSLSEEQAWSLSDLANGEWHPGPYIADAAIPHLGALREAGLIEREFGDLGAPETDANRDGFSLHLHACWWFKATSLGAATADYLRARAAQHDHEVG